MNSMVAFTQFELSRLARNWKFLAITVGFPVIFYMLFLRDHNAGTIVDGTVTWRVYLMVSMCSFGALVATLNAGGSRLSTERASGWARQLRVTPIPAWSYVATKVVATMLIVLPVVVLVELVGMTFGGVHYDLLTWLELTLLLWVATIPFALLGIFVGFMVHAETAYPVVTALMFILGYFGGLFSPVSHMPHALQTAARLLPSFHQTSMGLALLDGRGFGVQDILVLTAYAVVLGIFILGKHKLEEARGLA
ncbi:MAG TPA: ABC transporter permease [Acidimicrobiales bacterium]|nr:ABC transporter permease [Acidimicrobiales bacterium]